MPKRDLHQFMLLKTQIDARIMKIGTLGDAKYVQPPMLMSDTYYGKMLYLKLENMGVKKLTM